MAGQPTAKEAPEGLSDGVRLDPETVEEIARRVVELLDGPPQLPQLLTAAKIAARLEVTEAWVRENAKRLGAVELNDGPRPRLRFDPGVVAAALALRPVGSVSSEEGSGSGAGNVARRRRRGPAVIGQKVPIVAAAVSDHRVKAPASPEKRGVDVSTTTAPNAPRTEPSTPAGRSPTRAARAGNDGASSEKEEAR